MDKQFFVGPSKLNIIKQPKLSPTPIPLKPPTKRRPRRNPVHEAQQTFQVGVDQHREHFRHFLRSSLALLDGDIVETVIKEFDNHCSCENRAVESASHFLATATMNRVLPELRQLQLVIDAAETSCTDECVHVINQQRLVTMSQSRVDDLIAIEMPPEKGGVHPGTQVDLMLLGGVNDLLAWGEQLRDTLITAYRRAEQGPQSDLNGIQSNNGTQHGSKSSGKKSSRPSTAPSKRRPPASGGFGGGGTQDYTGSQNRNIYGTTTKRRPQSASKKRTTTNNNNTSNHNNSNHSNSNSNSNHSNMVASLYRRDEDKPEERRLLRQTLGSYYSADNSSSSNLNALLTSSGGFGGIRNPMPNVKRNKSKKNPNNYTKQRAKSRAKNQVDLAHYNAFHARPMLRRGGTASNSNLNFDGTFLRKKKS